MIKIDLKKEERFLEDLKEIFSLIEIAQYLYENKLGIVIILSHIKAKEWPRKDQELNNEPINEIPFLWAISYAENKENIKIIYDIHPGKCLPSKFNQENNISKKKKLRIENNNFGTLAGCARYFVEVNGFVYKIFEKIPLYCSIFGIPDDCFCPNLEKIMIETLKRHKNLELWCFEETEYITENVLPNIQLKFMKGDLLPSIFFPFVDSSSKFLRGIFKINDLNPLNSEPWYSQCYELINEFNPFESKDYFRYEEKALYFIKKKLIFEFIRLFLLISNRDNLEQYNVNEEKKLNLKYFTNYIEDIEYIKQKVIKETQKSLKFFLNENQSSFNFEKFKKSRFLVLDVEYTHICYPNGKIERIFNFPCIITNIIWKGIRKGFDINVNIFTLPCHFCGGDCEFFRKKIIKFECLNFDLDFYQNQLDLFNELLATYEGFKLYSYGKSDFFQLEQLSNFFTDSFEIKEFHTKNRVKTRRLIELAEDLAIQDKSLKFIEENIIKKQFPSWSRTKIKEKISKRFITKYKTPNWKENYKNIIIDCANDTISTLLYLICKEF